MFQLFLLNNFKTYFIYMYVHVSSCMCAYMPAGAQRGYKMVLDLMELELQTFVTCLMLVLIGEHGSSGRAHWSWPLSYLFYLRQHTVWNNQLYLFNASWLSGWKVCFIKLHKLPPISFVWNNDHFQYYFILYIPLVWYFPTLFFAHSTTNVVLLYNICY